MNVISRSSFPILFLFATFLLLSVGSAPLVGCSSNAEKMKLVLEPRLEKCRSADGHFATLPDASKGEKKVIKAACDEPLTEPVTIDEFHGEARTGPYVWFFNYDDNTGAWTCTGVEWPSFESAEHALNVKDHDELEFKRALDNFNKAMKEWPKSEYVVLRRFAAGLGYRQKTRKKSDDPYALGQETESLLEETKRWGVEHNKQAVGKTAEAMAANYFRKQVLNQREGLEAIGGQDSWLEKSIEAAKNAKNEVDMKKYTEELEDRRARRPAAVKKQREQLYKVTQAYCEHLKAAQAIKAEDIAIEGLPKASELLAAGSSIDCSPHALEALKKSIDEPYVVPSDNAK